MTGRQKKEKTNGKMVTNGKASIKMDTLAINAARNTDE